MLQREVDSTGRMVQAKETHVPYVTWDIQDLHLVEIESAINDGHDLLTDKSREMGASWNHIVALTHQFLYVPGALFLELSRTEPYVDDPGNPKSLMYKHDYVLKWLPEWMRPRMNRVRMKIENLENGSRIDGESTTPNAARGDRRRAMLFDEFAAVENGRMMRSSSADVTSCRLVNSTPLGAGTEYSRWAKSGQIKVFRLPWWEHPQKGRGRYASKDENTGQWRIRSPWYDIECGKRSPQEVARELDMNHVDSGATFFDGGAVDRHKAMFGRPALFHGRLDFVRGVANDAIPALIQRKDTSKAKFTLATKAPWRFWFHLVSGRPDQTRNYVFGIDISKGMGASNSVISVMCAETREKIAEFADATVPPYDLARIVVAAALWFGGSRGRPLIVWESNGDPGIDFGKVLVRQLQYPSVFLDGSTQTLAPRKTLKYGWHSSPEKKAEVLAMYNRALVHGGIINHSIEALDEAKEYVYYDANQGIGPAAMTEENENARLTHGDRVIADMLLLLGVEESPKSKPGEVAAPWRSVAWRKQAALKQRKEMMGKDRWCLLPQS